MIQMHGHPTLGVKNAKPRLSSKPGPKIGKLSEEYLRVRNEQMRTKNLAAQNRLPEGVRTRKCQNCPVRENPKGTILGVEREFAPLERLEDTAEGHLVLAPSEKRPLDGPISIAKQSFSVDRHLRRLRAP
jgi:hypothetical protein